MALETIQQCCMWWIVRQESWTVIEGLEMFGVAGHTGVESTILRTFGIGQVLETVIRIFFTLRKHFSCYFVKYCSI